MGEQGLQEQRPDDAVRHLAPPELWDELVDEAVGEVRVIHRHTKFAAPARFAVLSSSSSGNSSVILHQTSSGTRATLIDCGLSPKRTNELLETLGASIDCIDRIVMTHFDSDHFNSSWVSALPDHARFVVHRGHRGVAGRRGALTRRTDVFDDTFELAHGVRGRAILMKHDDLGASAFRFDFAMPGGRTRSLGYATDIGAPSQALARTLMGVDVLAIESNYCPVLQRESDRPIYLKRRITGGSGHLSNGQCASLVRAIGPRRAVVLLHLSRDCNTPEAALLEHAPELEAGLYDLVVASPDAATEPIPLTAD
ncbi:MAG: MBL fold metallo-hydrolase [Phycisphaerales bacterium]|nr:MBL fold metallo-hydrolase [Phycisphaerales bacterium]